MTFLLIPLLFFAQTGPPPLAQIKAEPNLERRAKQAVDFAVAAERAAESAYSNGDLAAVAEALKNTLEGIETAREALELTGQRASRHPGPYKAAELKTEGILKRLGDLEKRMDSEEREMVVKPRARIQEIHDVWFDGIMSKKK